MAVPSLDPPRVLAVLGPTNTGKTHFAVERMLAHRSGMIGCPLRLLAREIYDRIVALRGPGAVALITGEEKRAPATARYFVCTTEAMPQDHAVGFLAVDEVQLAADRERGHVFTDRLLRARGLDETMFLGSDTVRPLLKRLVPEAEVVTRPRFSTLAYAGTTKLSRLPRRSAVVAFTAGEVYALAEIIRRRRGGAAVVLGALSPRTRNAQVALFQSGEVDYMVATDAIGMGLNMDLGHVTFAELAKFDGYEHRQLTAPELAQIAGRAGRHMRDGTFGTTTEAGGLDERLVEAIESHSFPPLKQLRWRNAALDFASLAALQDSLDAPPPDPALIRVRDALDDVSLRLLGRRGHVRERLDGSPAAVRLLWDVCQIPDFRKTLTDAHLNLLDTVFGHLAERGRLPTDWVADQIARLDRTDGDIDALTTRLAHVRTWTYVSHRADWLRDASHWQERASEVEDRLGDALHERLTQRFVDRRTSALLKSLRERGEMFAAVAEDGEVLVDGHLVGRLTGLTFAPESAATADAERRALNGAARRAVVPELRRRALALIESPDDALDLDDRGRIVWRGAAVGRLLPGATPLGPRIGDTVGDELSGRAREAVRRRLAAWFERRVGAVLRPLRRRQAAELVGHGRGLAYLLVENLGGADAAEAGPLLAALTPGDRAALTRLGVRFGVHGLYLPAMLKADAVRARARLWAVYHQRPDLAPPPPGRVSLARDPELPDGFYRSVGYRPFGDIAVRVDVLERLAARLRALAREGGGEGGDAVALPPELASLTGLGGDDLALVVRALGYRQRRNGGGTEGEPARFVRTGRSGGSRRRPRPAELPPRADSPFAVLGQLRRQRG